MALVVSPTTASSRRCADDETDATTAAASMSTRGVALSAVARVTLFELLLVAEVSRQHARGRPRLLRAAEHAASGKPDDSTEIRDEPGVVVGDQANAAAERHDFKCEVVMLEGDRQREQARQIAPRAYLVAGQQRLRLAEVQTMRPCHHALRIEIGSIRRSAQRRAIEGEQHEPGLPKVGVDVGKQRLVLVERLKLHFRVDAEQS